MKRWQRALNKIRLLGPDIPAFDREVQYIWWHIKYLEDQLENEGR